VSEGPHERLERHLDELESRMAEGGEFAPSAREALREAAEAGMGIRYDRSATAWQRRRRRLIGAGIAAGALSLLGTLAMDVAVVVYVLQQVGP
jgi:hypothetical protein